MDENQANDEVIKWLDANDKELRRKIRRHERMLRRSRRKVARYERKIARLDRKIARVKRWAAWTEANQGKIALISGAIIWTLILFASYVAIANAAGSCQSP